MNANAEVHAAISLLGQGLDAHIEQVMWPHIGETEWPKVLEILDADRGKSAYTYARHDVALQLRMLTERLGSLGFPFDLGDKNRTLSAYGSVLRIVRKRWAHNDEFSPFDGLAAIETIRTVLAHISDDGRAAQAAELRSKVVNALWQEGEATSTGRGDAEKDEPGNGTEEPEPTVGEEGTDDPGTIGVSEETGVGTLRRSRTVQWEPWEIALVGEQEDLDSLRTKRVKEVVRSLIEDIVDAEGPVHKERLGRLVGYGFGFTRVRDSRRTRILGQVKNAPVEEDSDGFIWPRDVDRSRWLISRIAPKGGRIFEEISPVELANALVEVLQRDGTLSMTEANRRVLALFGRSKLSKQSIEHFRRVLMKAEQSGRVTVQGDTVAIP